MDRLGQTRMQAGEGGSYCERHLRDDGGWTRGRVVKVVKSGRLEVDFQGRINTVWWKMGGGVKEN